MSNGSSNGAASGAEMKRRALPGPSGGGGVPLVPPDLASLFECPVCFDYVLPPILQCQSGHLVCSCCRPKLSCCPTCRGPLGNIRNLAMEKVASTVMFPCKHSSNGCTSLQLYGEKVEHEDVCEYRPFSCPCPGASCKWLGSLEQVMPHLVMAHKSITTLQGEDIVFLATDINLAGAVDWVMMQSCFGHCFMLVLEKQEKYDGHQQFFALVQLIGSRKQAENFGYRLELNRHRRRLTWEATPRSIHEGIASAIVSSDCLVFDTSVAQLFADNGNLGINVTISVTAVVCCQTADNLTGIRLEHLTRVARNLLAAAGYHIVLASDPSHPLHQHHLQLVYAVRSTDAPSGTLIRCNHVVTSEGERCLLTHEQYKKLREDDIRAMAEHKYWDHGHESTIQRLVDATIIIDLVQVKTSCPVRINTESDVACGIREATSKGAAFLLYNHVRLTMIQRKFEKGVAEGTYTSLPPLEDIDTSLLSQLDEWRLLFDYLIEYPRLLNNITKNCQQGEINQHTLCNFMFKMCHCVSVYYRHSRILLEPKPHLLPIIHARLTLVKAIEAVMKHSMKLLNILPVDYM